MLDFVPLYYTTMTNLLHEQLQTKLTLNSTIDEEMSYS